MKGNKYLFIFLSFWAVLVGTAPSFAGITFSQNQVEVVIAPTCNHVPISIPYMSSDESYDESLITVSSDSNWAIPSVNSMSDRIEIAFSTKNLIASYTATVSVNDGEKVIDLFINVTVKPLDIYRLIDDPIRPMTYGIQRNGIYSGSIIAFDPIQESITSCITTGKAPTDFVINDDSTELLVINSVDKSIDIIDLEVFFLKETINLPSYSAWGSPGETTANIDLGPGDIIYYSDGAGGPVLHVLKRSTNEVLQSISFNGSSPTNNTGFMDFAVTSDKTKMIAMPQYGWSAGSHSPTIGQFTINGDGTVTLLKVTTLSNFSREPFEAPVLLSNDDQIAVMKTISTDPSNIDNLVRVFPSAVWSMLPNGKIVATGDKLYEYDTGIVLYNIPGGSTSGSGYTYTKAQAFTSDYTRFIYFNSSNRTLNVVNLISEIGVERLGVTLSPKDGAVTTSPATLAWEPIHGVEKFDVYLGPDHDAIATADHDSPYYLGSVTAPSFALSQQLSRGTEYFWRVDPVTEFGSETGLVYSFRVSDIGLDISEIFAQTIAGYSDYQVDIHLVSEQPGISWSASAAEPWVTFTESTGTTPATLGVHLDTTSLSTGLHDTTITLATGSDELLIPVRLIVEPLKITHIRSDRSSAKAYAISEDTASSIPHAYLLEVDSAAEKIERVVPVGSSVTDLAIHYADNLIYVTNWKSGNLLVIDKNTFEHVKNHAFNPAGAIGYMENDVYRVAAGVSKRLVIEEYDQWIDINIYNTSTGTTLASAFVREGGGAFDPTGRYYYHGENNSSGASIIKFDTSGDSFTELVEIRPPEISSYYGSRTVVVSEDGSRIFWSGVALDQNLATMWRVGEIVYSTSADGRYAFCESAIYDVNLRRQVFAMPTSTKVSGFNSTTNKLITQVGANLGFYAISTPISMPAPTLSLSDQTINSAKLSWIDKSLEMAFYVQQRVLGTDTWTDIKTTAANATSWTVTGLQPSFVYEFRVRASSPDYSSPWSNIVQSASRETPDVSVWPVASPITYGQTLTSSSLTGGAASVAGIFAWTTPSTMPVAGTSSWPVTFTPTDTNNYSAVTVNVSVSVTKANQTIPGLTFNRATLTVGGTATVTAGGGGGSAGGGLIVVGGSVDGSLLNIDFESSTPGITLGLGRLASTGVGDLGAIPDTLSVMAVGSGNPIVFTSKTTGVCTVSGSTVTGIAFGTCTIAANQAGSLNYNAAQEVTANIEVVKGMPTVNTWPTAGAVTYGQTLWSSTLSGGSATVPGTFAWTTPGTAPNAGTASQPVRFTPTDAANYNTVEGSVSVTVAKVGQTIEEISFNPTSIEVGETTTASATATSGIQVSFSSTTPSTCSVSGPTITALSPGRCTIAADQGGNANYNPAPRITRDLAIAGKLTPEITAWPTTSAITFGQTLASSTLSGGAASVGGSFAWTTPSTAPGAGTVSRPVTFTPTDTANFITVTENVIVIVAKASQTIGEISFNPASMEVGGTATASATATSGIAVSFTSVTPLTCSLSGATITALASGRCTVAADQGGNANYIPAPQITQDITVGKGTPVVIAWPTASTITYGQTLASSTLTGGSATVEGTFAWTTSSTVPGAGTASRPVTFTPTDTANYTTVAGSASVKVKHPPRASVTPNPVVTNMGRVVNIPLVIVDDYQGDIHSIAVRIEPEHGAIALRGVGNIQYYPMAGYFGDDSFVLTVTDKDGDSVDVTVGISITRVATYVDLNVANPSRHTEAINPVDVKMADLNGDGPLDMIVADAGNQTSSPAILVYMSDLNGGFILTSNIPVTGKLIGVSVMDTDGDGDLDIVALVGVTGAVKLVAMADVPQSDSGVQVFNNAGTGVMVEGAFYSLAGEPNDILMMLLNDDGYTDMVIASENAVTTYLGDGSGRYIQGSNLSMTINPKLLLPMDMDGNSKNDIFAYDTATGKATALLLGSNGSIAADPDCTALDLGEMLVGAIDWDGDGENELAMVDKYLGDFVVWSPNGDGTFTEELRVTGQFAAEIFEYADINGDGNKDISITGGKDMLVLFSDGTGGVIGMDTLSFDEELKGITYADVDGDGKDDLITLGKTNQAVTVNSVSTPVIRTPAQPGSGGGGGGGGGCFLESLRLR